MLDDILGRLGPLGLTLRPGTRHNGSEENPRPLPGAWSLHAMLIETLQDLGGLDFDASVNVLELEPVLPPGWPSVGLTAPLACGEVGYRLDLNRGVPYHLTFHGRLKRQVSLKVDLTCPGLAHLGAWQSRPEPQAAPAFEGTTGRLRWTVDLPEGDVKREWTWG
jgi:hypothetical protein